jgi:DMSO/TMAO reductase YedYZ molybdopterin-dependent catalytic subunit
MVDESVPSTLAISGEVEHAGALSFADLAALPAEFHIADVSRIDSKRSGAAVRLEGLLRHVGVRASAAWLSLHASRDDFHASIPLAAVRERAIVIYRVGGEPLPASAGGPFRFFVPDFAACHSADVDECANVKFVDRIELSAVRGYDNRPHDAAEHADLHAKESTNP